MMKLNYSLAFSVAALMPSLASASSNAALYKCEPDVLRVDNICLFVAADPTTFLASPHYMDITIAQEGFRMIHDEFGSPVMPSTRPFTQGDTLVASQTEVEGDMLRWVQAFELVAPLRDGMMYYPDMVTQDYDIWQKLTRALVDCSIKDESEVESRGSGLPDKILYGVDDIYTLMQDPKMHTPSPDISAPVLQFLEDAAEDLACIMVSTIESPRCTVMRSRLNLTPGEASFCWLDGYEGLFADTNTAPAAAPVVNPSPVAAPVYTPVYDAPVYDAPVYDAPVYEAPVYMPVYTPVAAPTRPIPATPAPIAPVAAPTRPIPATPAPIAPVAAPTRPIPATPAPIAPVAAPTRPIPATPAPIAPVAAPTRPIPATPAPVATTPRCRDSSNKFDVHGQIRGCSWVAVHITPYGEGCFNKSADHGTALGTLCPAACNMCPGSGI